MKAIGFTLNNLDFIINSLQPTGMDGISAMVDNSIGKPHEHFCKVDKRWNTAFTGHGTPGLKRVLAGFWVFVMPDFLQIVL